MSFCRMVQLKFPQYFRGTTVLDVGSLDVNGNNRHLFQNCRYIGVDVGEGPNVDVVTLAHEYQAAPDSFDVVISTECFEHDRYYRETLTHIVSLLKPRGLLLFTCATTGRAEHGTLRRGGGDSPLTVRIKGWENYYRNLEEGDVREVIPIDSTFERYDFIVNESTKDLYFWGIKKSR